MIVERWTWTTKVGRRDEAIELGKALLELNGFKGRICTHMSGVYNAITWYQEFETMEDLNKYKKEFITDFTLYKKGWIEYNKL